MPQREDGPGGGSSKDLIMIIKCNLSSPIADGWWINFGATKHIAQECQDLVESKLVNPKEHLIRG